MRPSKLTQHLEAIRCHSSPGERRMWHIHELRRAVETPCAGQKGLHLSQRPSSEAGILADDGQVNRQ